MQINSNKVSNMKPLQICMILASYQQYKVKENIKNLVFLLNQDIKFLNSKFLPPNYFRVVAQIP